MFGICIGINILLALFDLKVMGVVEYRHDNHTLSLHGKGNSLITAVYELKVIVQGESPCRPSF